MRHTMARERLARSRAPYLLERTLNAVSTPLAVFDARGREIVLNRALRHLLGTGEEGAGLLERMRQAARGGATRDHGGRYALRSRPLARGGLMDAPAVLVNLEPA